MSWFHEDFGEYMAAVGTPDQIRRDAAQLRHLFTWDWFCPGCFARWPGDVPCPNGCEQEREARNG